MDEDVEVDVLDGFDLLTEGLHDDAGFRTFECRSNSPGWFSNEGGAAAWDFHSSLESDLIIDVTDDGDWTPNEKKAHAPSSGTQTNVSSKRNVCKGVSKVTPIAKKVKTTPRKKSAKPVPASPVKGPSALGEKSGKVLKLRTVKDDVIVDVVDDSKHRVPERRSKRNLIRNTSQVDLPGSLSFKMDSASPVHQRDSNRATNLLERLNIVYSLPKPTHFKVIDPEIVLKEEEFLFPEFFGAGRNQGALLQKYLRIRSHMIAVWNAQKPKYVSKSAARRGLRNTGEADLLERVHAYLEQKGIINYGCDQCHYNDESTSANQISLSSRKATEGIDRDVWSNPLRTRRKKSTEDESVSGDGKNYTFAHEENGLIHLAHISSELTHQQEKKLKTKNQAMTLVHCKRFDSPPYKIAFHLQSYLVAEVHSHASCNLEIMGLLGGKFCSEKKKMEIKSCVPCYVLSSTNVHCDMCPVSQCDAKELIELNGLDVVGWYHSHPGSMPEPSPQDIVSQDMYQSHFAHSSAPFVGLILSPFSHYSPKFFVLFKSEPFEVHFELTFQEAVNTTEMRAQMCSTLTKVSAVTPFDKEMPKKSRTYLQTCQEHFQKLLSKAPIGDDEKSAILTTINDVLTYSEDEAIFDIEVLE